MSQAPHPQDIRAVDVDELEATVAVVFSWFAPKEDEPTRGDTLLQGEKLKEVLDDTHDAVGDSTDNFADCFLRATALYSYCGTVQPPSHLFENGFPGRILCTAAANAPVIQIPGAGTLIAFDLDREAMSAAIAAAQK